MTALDPLALAFWRFSFRAVAPQFALPWGLETRHFLPAHSLAAVAIFCGVQSLHRIATAGVSLGHQGRGHQDQSVELPLAHVE